MKTTWPFTIIMLWLLGMALPCLPGEIHAAQLTITKVDIDFRDAPDNDRAKVKGTLTLDTSSDGIAPLSDVISVTIGSIAVTIPGGSLVLIDDRGTTRGTASTASNEAKFEFDGPVDGAEVKFKLKTTDDDDTFKITIVVKSINIASISNPLDISVAIGDDVGSGQVRLNGKLQFRPSDDGEPLTPTNGDPGTPDPTPDPPTADFPDITGTYGGSSTLTATNCENEDDNGTATIAMTLVVTSQTGADFMASMTFNTESSVGPLTTTFEIVGTVTVTGEVDATLSYTSVTAGGVFDSSGEGQIDGVLSSGGASLNWTFQDTNGDSCSGQGDFVGVPTPDRDPGRDVEPRRRE